MVLSCEELFVLDGLVCEAVGLPFVIFVEYKCFDFFDVSGGESGIGLTDDVCEAFFVGAYTEDGFFDAERFKELGGHKSVSVVVGSGVGEDEDDSGLVVELERFVLGDIAVYFCGDVVLQRELSEELLSLRVGVNN